MSFLRKFLVVGALCISSAYAGNHAIRGKVIDRNGDPVAQAIVSLSPVNVELITDRQGQFSIEYLRNTEGERMRLLKREDYTIEFYKVGFHVESRTFFYKRGDVTLQAVRLVEESIRVRDDNAELTESLETKPTHSAGANYEGQ